jgi:hypothetical protein
MSDELEPQVDASVTETPSAPAEPVSTPDLSVGSETVTSTPAPEWRGVRDVLPEYGLANDQFEDDASALRYLAEQTRQHQQIQPYWNQVSQDWTAYQQWKAQQNQPQQPPQQAPEKKPYWEPLPELDQAWLQMVARDPGTGQIVVKPEYRGAVAPDLPQKVQAYLHAKQDREAKLLNDPVGAIWGGVEEKLNGILEQRERQLAEKMHADFQARQYIRDNATKLFQFDANGQPLADPTTGQPAYSPYGHAFAHFLNEATQLGIADHSAREQYARRLAQAHVSSQPQPVPQAPVTPAPQQPKGNFLTNRVANRAGTIASAQGQAGVPQDDDLPIGQQLRRAMLAGGYTDEQITGQVPINGHA